jgi:hypothetical protein
MNHVRTSHESAAANMFVRVSMDAGNPTRADQSDANIGVHIVSTFQR